MGTKKYRIETRKGLRGSMAVGAAAAGLDRAGRGAGRGVPGPSGKGSPNATYRVWEPKQRGAGCPAVPPVAPPRHSAIHDGPPRQPPVAVGASTRWAMTEI